MQRTECLSRFDQFHTTPAATIIVAVLSVYVLMSVQCYSAVVLTVKASDKSEYTSETKAHRNLMRVS